MMPVGVSKIPTGFFRIVVQQVPHSRSSVGVQSVGVFHVENPSLFSSFVLVSIPHHPTFYFLTPLLLEKCLLKGDPETSGTTKK